MPRIKPDLRKPLTQLSLEMAEGDESLITLGGRTHVLDSRDYEVGTTYVILHMAGGKVLIKVTKLA